MTNRYSDAFLNALMESHQITARAELWYPSAAGQPYALVGPLTEVAGVVTGNRTGSVRRTAQVQISSDLTDAVKARLSPYGARVKIYRGIRYPSGTPDEVQVFYGRIDSIDGGIQTFDVRCSDLAADVVDARFLKPTGPSNLPGAPTTILNTIKALISDVHAGITFNMGAGLVDRTLVAGTSWSQERSDALDSLCTQVGTATVVGSEWFIDMAGVGTVKPLPAVITATTPAVWIIDTGDGGVLVDRVGTIDRANVHNGVAVTGEPIGGITPAEGYWTDDNPTSDTLWGGPFGKVVAYYTGQQLDPNDTLAAYKLAQQLGLNSIASVRSLNVTCVPNPKLQLGDVVRVYTARSDWDGMYFVQNFTLPLDAQSPMTMTLYQSLEEDAARGWQPATERIPEGATWRPTRLTSST